MEEKFVELLLSQLKILIYGNQFNSLFIPDVDRFISKDFSEHNPTFWDEIIKTRKNSSPIMNTSLPRLMLQMIPSLILSMLNSSLSN